MTQSPPLSEIHHLRFHAFGHLDPVSFRSDMRHSFSTHNPGHLHYKGYRIYIVVFDAECEAHKG